MIFSGENHRLMITASSALRYYHSVRLGQSNKIKDESVNSKRKEREGKRKEGKGNRNRKRNEKRRKDGRHMTTQFDA